MFETPSLTKQSHSLIDLKIDFQPDPEIVSRIVDLRKARPALDAALWRHENRKKIIVKRSASAAFLASTFAAHRSVELNSPLARSFLADTGADSHTMTKNFF